MNEKAILVIVLRNGTKEINITMNKNDIQFIINKFNDYTNNKKGENDYLSVNAENNNVLFILKLNEVAYMAIET